MKIKIPLTCPKCGGSMSSISYDPVLPILKHRSWQCCDSCKFVRETDEFKKGLLTV